MKIISLLLTLVLLSSLSCKTVHKKEENTPAAVQKTASLKTKGVVSHQYRSTGCETVIIIAKDSQEEPLVLIPIEALAEEWDKDGQVIFFNYTLSRMRNPEGCEHGIPGVIKDIEVN